MSPQPYINKSKSDCWLTPENIKEYIGDINTFLSEKDLESFKQLESSQRNQKNTKQDKIKVLLKLNH